ncbi:peptidyl-prolyl cis-trans isomerase FKBP13, chloroplastic-like isoform X2 [Apium graveolens]|uniref:peptidyl-prolyl cis-trans isomerase FKBP13, chloroplastic-like isoform X2 n=1 Tax=Apium graveolens TaxID=4045 RepID=UPI003D7B9FFB
MSSLAFSLASPTHTKQIRTSFTTQASSAFKIYANHEQKFNNKCTSQQLQVSVEKTTNSLFRRREVIGLGLSFTTVLDFLGQNVATAAEATAPCEFTTTPSGLAFCDKVVGFGPEASKGQLIKAHYTGKLENGKVFDSSYNRGKPLTFRIGVGEVIKGWDQGILGGDGVPPMLAGGKRTLKLPPQLGYGMRGAGCKGGSCIIPPDSVLLFDVEFIGKA